MAEGGLRMGTLSAPWEILVRRADSHALSNIASLINADGRRWPIYLGTGTLGSTVLVFRHKPMLIRLASGL